MAEYIEREDAYNVLTEYYHHSTEVQHEALREAIERVPAADVQPVKHGKWVNDIQCSNCGWYMEDDVTISPMMVFFDYCPHCGATMDGET